MGGDVYDALLPGAAFEHFHKERCLIPAHRFATWRAAARATPWWRATERMRQVPPALLDAVESEVARMGPVCVADLADRGRAVPVEWSGWKGTPKLAKLAIETLWRQCRVVVCGRTSRGKMLDVPERALPASTQGDVADFDRTVLGDRVVAAGLLSELAGPHWSMLADVRCGALPDELVAEGVLERVQITGARRTYLAPAGFRDVTFPDDDGRMRPLGPLDPMLWDRRLVWHAFGFAYVWEVYKPKEKREYGCYVVPLLHDGRLVARLEAHVVQGELVVDHLWREAGVPFDEAAFDAMIARHAAAMVGR